MKRIAMFIVMLAVIAVGASALQVSAPVLGSLTQERNTNVTTQFTITNDGTSTLSGITILTTGNTAYSLAVPSSTPDLTPGAQVTLTVAGFIPLSHSGVDPTTLDEQALPVGTITVQGTNSSGAQQSAVVNVSAQAKNQLNIKKVRIQCDTTSKSLSNGDTVKNLKPGESCSMEVQVENLFNDNENALKTSGIEFTTTDVRVESGSNDVDVNDNSDSIDNLNAGDDDSLSFDLTIEDDADAHTVSVDITVKATDENGAIHGETRHVRMEVVRVTHDIQVKRIEVSPSRIETCDATNVRLAVGVLNLGKRDEKDAAVEVTANDLKFVKKSATVELDKNDETTINFDIPVPKNQKAGTVRIDAQTFFDTLAASNTASVDLIVEPCSADAASTPVVSTTTGGTATPVVTQTQPSTVIVPASSSGTAAAPKKTSSFTDSNAYVALLVVASVVILLVLIGMIAMLVRRKQP